MASFCAEVLDDPLGVAVGLVCAADATLERSVVEAAVAGVAPGRQTRRRLAQALLDRPTVLVEGTSPAPRVVGDLLVAMRDLGSVKISAPRCAGCAKVLRSFQRRGQCWYCTRCGKVRVACSACGVVRVVTTVDREGKPRCSSCPPDGDEPLEIALRVVAGAEPSLDAAVVTAAFESVTSRAGQRRQLAWAIENRPDLLTGAGAEAPVPSVLRLIDALCQAGASAIVRPACPHCRRVVTLSKFRGGLRICRGCEARLRAVPCARCGAVRDPVTRDDQGRPVCPNCFMRDPANQETCARCGHRRPVSMRSPEGPLCPSCRPTREMTCSICGRRAPAEIAKATGQPWCRACQSRWAACAACGQVRPIRGGTTTSPLCATCTRPDASFWKTCPSCGEASKLTIGACLRCSLAQRLRQLLGGADGAIAGEMRGLYDSLAGAERPDSVLAWLKGSDAAGVLAGIGTGRLVLSHEALDGLVSAKSVEHLRAMLVATGALPARDEQMVRLERWVAAAIAERTDPDEAQVLRRYGVWHLLRRLRRRQKGGETTPAQTTVVRRNVRAATNLLDGLACAGQTLASADQGHLDAWLASGCATRSAEVGHFIRWAKRQKLTRLELATVRWDGPRGSIDADKRWEQARRLLRDDAIDAGDRVAGLLVLLYAQRAAAVSRLRLSHVDNDLGGVRLRLGAQPVVLPEPVAGLVLFLVSTRRGHGRLGDPGTSPWLFPGGQPGRPISASRMTERLRDLGIQAGPARSSALLQLATELPAAVIARLLGIHIKVAAEWQRIASGDWMGYAADYSRRDPAGTVINQG